MAGRKSKLNHELLGKIETSLQNHNSVKATCDLLGISQTIWFRWLQQGEAIKAEEESEEDSPPAPLKPGEKAPEPVKLTRKEKADRAMKVEFVETVKRSQAMSKLTLLNKIQSDPSWQAKAWILERQHPSEFGRRQLIAHAGADGESEMPVASAAAPVNLVLKIQRPEKAPWTFATEPDQDDTEGSDPWDKDHVEFQAPEPESIPEPPAPPAPKPAANTRPAPIAAIHARRNSLDGIVPNQGRPTDPDANL